jgi:hypothetical protein
MDTSIIKNHPPLSGVLMLKQLGLVAIIFGLVGCATPTLPEMYEYDYQTAAVAIRDIHECHSAGHIDTTTAARGRNYIQSRLNKYTWDRERLSISISTLEALTSDEMKPRCKNIALSIEQQKQQIDISNAVYDMQRQNLQNIINQNKTTNTYCTGSGSSYFCRSY